MSTRDSQYESRVNHFQSASCENTDTEEKAIERLKGVEIAISDCYIAPLNKKVLESADALKLLAINSTGYDWLWQRR